MFLYIDSGDRGLIKQAMTMVQVHGITTNPKLSTPENAVELLQHFRLPTSVTVDAYEEIALLPTADPLLQVKVSVTDLPLARRLIADGLQVNLTLCMSLAHVIAAANIGAAMVSVFVGRLLDQNHDAGAVLRAARAYLDLAQSPTKLLAASIRTQAHLELAAASGADIVTVPPQSLTTILDLQNHMSVAGMQSFATHQP